MNTNRRDFLKGMAWMGVAAAAAGCSSGGMRLTSGGAMQGFAAPALKKVRLGIVGLGMRGSSAVKRLCKVPGVEIAAVCDVIPERAAEAAKIVTGNGKPAPKIFTGSPEEWRKMVASDLVDAVYNVTPWPLHAPIAIQAMKEGKHAFIEVPAAMTIDECWELVETSEATRRHCMQLENCCYGEAELFALNLCRLGILGELVHGEGAYIHDLRDLCYRDPVNKEDPKKNGYSDNWRLKWNTPHKGNQYPTHGLGPVCQYMGINRGDRFDYLVSLESQQANYEKYGFDLFPEGDWRHGRKIAMGDMNTTLIKTALGRSIMIQHDVSSPRPYTRLNLISGTKGVVSGGDFADTAEKDYASGWPVRMGWEEKTGDQGAHKFFNAEKAAEMRMKYRHPLWKEYGDIATKVGGHGGMDFIMDLRWAYCLQNGLPLDMDVYDLAAWCSLCELTERSVRNRSCPVDVPDFTRGGWRTAKPLGIVDIDKAKLGIG